MYQIDPAVPCYPPLMTSQIVNSQFSKNVPSQPARWYVLTTTQEPFVANGATWAYPAGLASSELHLDVWQSGLPRPRSTVKVARQSAIIAPPPEAFQER